MDDDKSLIEKNNRGSEGNSDHRVRRGEEGNGWTKDCCKKNRQEECEEKEGEEVEGLMFQTSEPIIYDLPATLHKWESLEMNISMQRIWSTHIYYDTFAG